MTKRMRRVETYHGATPLLDGGAEEWRPRLASSAVAVPGRTGGGAGDSDCQNVKELTPRIQGLGRKSQIRTRNAGDKLAVLLTRNALVPKADYLYSIIQIAQG